MHVRQRVNDVKLLHYFLVKHIGKPNCIKQNSSVVAFRTLTRILYILRLEHHSKEQEHLMWSEQVNKCKKVQDFAGVFLKKRMAVIYTKLLDVKSACK